MIDVSASFIFLIWLRKINQHFGWVVDSRGTVFLGLQDGRLHSKTNCDSATDFGGCPQKKKEEKGDAHPLCMGEDMAS